MMDTAVEDGAVGMECELVQAWSLHGRTISGEGAPESGLFAGVTCLEKSDEETSGDWRKDCREWTADKDGGGMIPTVDGMRLQI